MNHRVGRLTIAATLIAVGVAVLIDNLQGTSITWYVAKFWPGLLVLLGLEWLFVAARSGGTAPIRLDGGAVVLLVIVGLVGASYVSAWRGPVVFRGNWSAPQIRFDGIPHFGGGIVSDEYVQTADLDMAQIRDLSIDGGSFSVTVREGDKAQVEFKVRAYGSNASDANENAHRFQLRVDKGANTRVSVDHPTSFSLQSSSFIITLPKGATPALRVETSSGSIQVYGHGGPLTAKASSGSVHAERINGSADLRSTSGSVTALGIQGEAAITTSSGSIRVENVRDSVKANSTSGSVNVLNAGKRVTAGASSGNVTVESKEVGGEYDLQATSGSVRLVIPASAGVTVDARASSGSVSGPSWLRIGEGRNSGSGTQGDGANRVTLRTSSGSIRVDAR